MTNKPTWPSANEFHRLVEWMKNPDRKPANIAFTAGETRQAARAFECYLEDIKEDL